MSIVIGSEGMGWEYGSYVLSYLLNKLGYSNIEYKNNDMCSFIVLSGELCNQPLWNTKPKKYIYYSGEHTTPDRNINEIKSLYVLTKLYDNINNYIYIPFMLWSSYIYKERKYINNDRKYLLAYCNNHRINEREYMFNLFVSKTNTNTCHSFSGCYGNYPQTRKPKIDGHWASSNLIDTYKDYKFVIAMENTVVNGYITEKILNAFYSGAIPIYWGSSTINNFFNKNAFINVSDFNTFEDCVNYVITMSDEQIRQMQQEPIYSNDCNGDLLDLLNLINDDYNNKNENKVLNEYLDKLKEFIA
jgi:hypothetical protein